MKDDNSGIMNDSQFEAFVQLKAEASESMPERPACAGSKSDPAECNPGPEMREMIAQRSRSCAFAEFERLDQ